MTEQTQAFFHHYRVMDTKVLLARHRAGGLLPEAGVALRQVLEDRGYAVEALEDNGAGEAFTLCVDETVEAPSVSMKAGRALPGAWQALMHKVTAAALQASARIRLRKTWVQIVRFGLIAVCLRSIQLATLFGMGLFVIANVFCDSGPAARCFHAGLLFFGTGAMADALLVPATVALLFPKKWLGRYLKAVPVLSLAVCAAAIHWYHVFPMFCAKAAELSALIAVLATVYLILSWKSAVPIAPEPV